MKQYVFLTLAITLGLVGSSMLKLCDGFTVLLPTALFAVSYIFAFYFFSLALKTLPLSSGYATWSGASTACNALIGLLVFHELISPVKVLALLLIVAGIVIINTHKADQVTGADSTETTEINTEDVIAAQTAPTLTAN